MTCRTLICAILSALCSEKTELGVIEKKGRGLIEEALYLTQRSFKVMGQKDLNSAASVVYSSLLNGHEGGWGKAFYYCSWKKLEE